MRGLLLTVVETLEQQVRRGDQAYQEQLTDVARHINLRALQDTNEMLFHRLVSDHIEDMRPILYTPTVRVGLPALQRDLPPSARAFHRPPRPRPHRGDPAQPASAGGQRHRRH